MCILCALNAFYDRQRVGNRHIDIQITLTKTQTNKAQSQACEDNKVATKQKTIEKNNRKNSDRKTNQKGQSITCYV